MKRINADYDRYPHPRRCRHPSDVHKERIVHNEDNQLKIYYTGLPRCL